MLADISFLHYGLVSIVIFLSGILIIKISESETFQIKKYQTLQKIHQGDVPRLGGVAVALGLIIFTYLNQNTIYFDFLFKISLAAIPFFLVSLIEDVYHNIKPILRFFAISLSAILFVYFSGFSLTKVQTPVLDFFMHYEAFSFLFTVIALVSITNAFNIIDASNGIASLTFIVASLSLFIASSFFQDPFIQYLSLSMAILPIGFLALNFPLGKIFLGDSGAYLLGFLIGTLVIVFFIRNPDAPKWLAILILAYPFFELIFSFLRKILLRQSPFEPDKKHLHLMVNDLTQSIYKKMNKKRHNNLRANNMNTVTLIFFWLSPLYFVYAHLAYNTPVFNLLTFYINIYLFFYLFISNILRDKK
jgi:UDP-N-acetylmuramyl pentapeptide phosphotransferase/UDP-N-acetylglucosamine-1-phosphate transferase